MHTAHIPALKRSYSRPFYWFNTALVYLTTLPAHWLLTMFGYKAGMLPLTIRIAEGSKGGIKAFQSYTPDAGDIVVCTYVKSGTNWLLQLAHQIAFHGAGEYAHIHDVVPWPDMQGGMIKSIPLHSTAVQQSSPERKRVIKTHLAAQHVPYTNAAHYLTVIRDPREVFVSSYHFALGSYGPLMPSLDNWFELFLSKDFPLNFGSSWAEHVASYWALRDKPNVLVLSFKDMKADLPGTARQIAAVLGVTLSEAQMAQVIDKSCFTYMSSMDHKFLSMPRENTPWGKHLKMLRDGRQGNSGELLTGEQQQRIDANCRAELQRLGSDFPYDEWFGKD